MKLIYFNFIIIILFCSCSKITDPYSYAPCSSSSSWAGDQKSVKITSKYCQAVLPKNYEYDNLTLAEIIDISLLNNPNTKASWAEARSKAASYGQSLYKYFPEMDIYGSYTKERYSNILPGSSQTFNQTTYTPELQISYTIFDFGQRKYSSQAAREALYYADLTHNRTIQTTIQTVMDDYYDYQGQKQTLIANEADLDSANATLDAAIEKFQNGVGSIADVTQAKSQYLQTKLDLLEQEKNVETILAKLKKDLGLPANLDISLQDLPQNAYVDEILSSVDELIAKAQNNRADLLAQEAHLKQMEAKESEARSDFFPIFTGDFDIGKNYYQHHHNEDYHYNLQLKISYPLFKGFFYKNALKAAKANVLQAKAELTEKELNIIQEITTTHFNVQTNTKSLRVAKEYVKEANINFDIALANYKAGTGNILDVIAAQSSLQDARAKKANVDKQWYSSIANLAYATGTLCGVQPQTCEKVCDE